MTHESDSIEGWNFLYKPELLNCPWTQYEIFLFFWIEVRKNYITTHAMW